MIASKRTLKVAETLWKNFTVSIRNLNLKEGELNYVLSFRDSKSNNNRELYFCTFTHVLVALKLCNDNLRKGSIVEHCILQRHKVEYKTESESLLKYTYRFFFPYKNIFLEISKLGIKLHSQITIFCTLHEAVSNNN